MSSSNCAVGPRGGILQYSAANVVSEQVCPYLRTFLCAIDENSGTCWVSVSLLFLKFACQICMSLFYFNFHFKLWVMLRLSVCFFYFIISFHIALRFSACFTCLGCMGDFHDIGTGTTVTAETLSPKSLGKDWAQHSFPPPTQQSKYKFLWFYIYIPS